MRAYACALSFVALLAGCKYPGEDAAACNETYDLPSGAWTVRDPFVFADAESGKYYIHANTKYVKPNPNATKEEVYAGGPNGLYCYESRDLKNWRYAGQSFKRPEEFWGKRDFWAPDMFKLDGKYYIIATFSCNRIVPGSKDPGNPLRLRGCAALVSDKPEGPYTPVSMDEPLTPKDGHYLDGTLWEEDGKLWLVYCHQPLEGEILAQEVSRDLKRAIGEPKLLFRASDAPWVGGAPWFAKVFGGVPHITDAGVINRAKDGTLFMTWSSFTKKGKYAVGIAVSENGKLLGKWKHMEKPLNNDDGGHAMLFKTFDGKEMISYHSPNKFPQRLTIRPFDFNGGNAVLGADICSDPAEKTTEAGAK